MNANPVGGETTPDPWRWLASTIELQRTAYGVDPPTLTGDERADYVLMNLWAAVDELGEFSHHVAWKPWATGRGNILNWDAAVDELVDVAHFIANLACVLGVDDEIWERRYQVKQDRNAARMASGTYAGVGDEDGYTGSKDLIRCRAIVSFWDSQASVTVMNASSTREPESYRLHDVRRLGGTVYVDAEYTARGANAAQIRRYAASLAQHAGRRISEHDVTLVETVETEILEKARG